MHDKRELSSGSEYICIFNFALIKNNFLFFYGLSSLKYRFDPGTVTEQAFFQNKSHVKVKYIKLIICK